MDNVFANYASTYLVFAAVLLVWFVFYKTRFGLRLRACGEHPQACETLGINVIKMRFACVCISGFLAGLGGACVTMTMSTQFRPISIVGTVVFFIAISVIFENLKRLKARADRNAEAAAIKKAEEKKEEKK